MSKSPKISLPMFRRMLQSMTPEQLRQLPAESLPDDIPLDLIEEAPPELRELLEDLSFSVSSRQLSEWDHDLKTFGREVASAIEYAGQHRPRSAAEAFDSAVEELSAQWRQQRREDNLDEVAFARRLERLGSVRELQDEAGRLGRAVSTIDAAIAEQGENERIRQAREQLMQDFRRIERSLASYHALSIDLVRREMHRKRNEIEAHAFEDEQLQKRLEVLNQRLQKSQSLLRRSLRPGVARQERERLETRIRELLKEREEREWVIDENDMTRWFDSVVDANLYLDENKHAQSLRDARMQLFKLLNLFCQQQEDAAQQVARNPFLQLDPQQAIEFLLISERFIVGYFAQKRKDLTRWLGGAAEQKLRELDDVQANILSEYKKHRSR
ncbi:MAG: hypothetical protein R3225_00635 [Halofilum sp. (in: g-proteobacteria)]|nr:hypothetical protein [Halofilum sp. (in: g-proteobacteria)]